MEAQLAQSRAEAATSSEALATLQAQSDERQAQHAALAEELAQLRLLSTSGGSSQQTLQAPTAAAQPFYLISQQLAKVITPFYGDYRDKGLTARAWSARVQLQLAGQHVPQEHWVAAAANGLRGNGQDWYYQCYQRANAAGMVTNDPFSGSFEVFSQQLQQQFMLVEDTAAAFNMLNSMTQGQTEEVSAYYFRFIAAHQRYQQAGGVTDDGGLLLTFQAGLRDTVRQWLSDQEQSARITQPTFSFTLESAARFLARKEAARPMRAPRRDYGGYSDPVAEQQRVTVNAMHADSRSRNKRPPSGAAPNTQAAQHTGYAKHQCAQRANGRPLLSDKEYERRMDARLCFDCEAPWEPGHRFSCPAKQAHGKLAPNGQRAQN